MGSSVVVGIDVGGTFTDVVAIDETSGEVRIAKVGSTRSREAQGFMDGLGAAIDEPSGVAAIVHGTTVGTNALLERRGARTAVITTQGFADVLEMRRRDRPHTWGLWGDFEPVAPRDLRVGVAERTLADGTVLQAVDPDDVVDAARTLLDRGAVAVAVTFLHSYAAPDNERVAAAALRAMWPNDSVSVSSEILPEIREFERTSTTTLNAYLQPVVGGYLAQLEADLAGAGFEGELMIVASNGGVMSVDAARRFPVRTALSGPAAGVGAAAAIAGAVGRDHVITGDVGGTSFDVAVVAGGRPVVTAETTIDFGLVVRTPMTEIRTIGAGGGSIASVDRSGLLKVGPESAGSVPGPVCYGLGNDRPTLTDAHLVLGRINPDRPIGGRVALDVDAAAAAIDAHVGSRLGLEVPAAAAAILAVATSTMAGALRVMSIERGHDPTRFLLVPFGGGGGLNCCELIDAIGLAGALVPRHPGVISALGCVMADMRHDGVQTLGVELTRLDVAELASAMAAAELEGRSLVESTGARIEEVEVRHHLDMSYVGQTHTVSAPLVDGSGMPVDAAGVDRDLVAAAFERTYRATYGELLDGVEVFVAGLRTTVAGRRPAVDLRSLGRPTTTGPSRAGERPLHVEGSWVTAAVIDRGALEPGDRVEGPAVLEQPDATTVLTPGFAGLVDELGNLEISRCSPGERRP
ncbi:MAG TPA: hydantoinase/oxoprolinase family protein [Microthrixaceae bacterium]|nr:hydantoinase/oxoprolinase family protein [Microthrixaceae bacterium]